MLSAIQGPEECTPLVAGNPALVQLQLTDLADQDEPKSSISSCKLTRRYVPSGAVINGKSDTDIMDMVDTSGLLSLILLGADTALEKGDQREIQATFVTYEFGSPALSTTKIILHHVLHPLKAIGLEG